MKILSVNAGSSSLKFTAYEMPEETNLISGVFERIGMEDSFYTIKFNGEKIKKEIDLPNHEVAFKTLMEEYQSIKVKVKRNNHIVEMIEIPEHPWFVACQFHPEFKSRPNKPHPLFRGFVTASYKHLIGE